MHKHFVLSVSPLPNLRLFVVFTDNSKRIYDVGNLVKEIPEFNELVKNESLFKQVTPVAKGAGIVWNDDLDLASDELFENGVEPTYA